MKNEYSSIHLLTIVDSGSAAEGSVVTENLTNQALVEHTIYSTTQLDSYGIILTYLSINRDIDEGAVKKKVVSIKKSKGVIFPCLIVSAKKCMDEGLEVHLADGSLVDASTPNLDRIYVIIDGQHRSEAIRRIKEANKDSNIECFYYLPLVGQESIVVSDLLREANIATYAWKDKEYLSNLIAMKENSSKVNLDLLKEISSHPEGKTKSLVHWFTLDKSKSIYSRQIVEAMADDNKLSSIANVDKDTFNMGKTLFEAASSRLGESEAGLTVYPDWVIDKLNSDVKKTRADMSDLLKAFFEKHLTDTDIKDLKSLKGDRSPYVSRDTKIANQLDSYWDKYIKK